MHSAPFCIHYCHHTLLFAHSSLYLIGGYRYTLKQVYITRLRYPYIVLYPYPHLLLGYVYARLYRKQHTLLHRICVRSHIMHHQPQVVRHTMIKILPECRILRILIFHISLRYQPYLQQLFFHLSINALHILLKQYARLQYILAMIMHR